MRKPMARNVRGDRGPIEFLSYHEARLREERRARQARTGIVSVISIFAVGFFAKDAPGLIAYCIGVLTVVLVGVAAGMISGSFGEDDQ